jgi:signal transduction histidine kinase
MRSTVHEMRNQLTVSVANIEAFIDGKLAPTRERLEAVLHALYKLDALMSDLKPAGSEFPPAKLQAVDVCALIYKESIAFEASAQAAGVTLSVDRCALEHAECTSFVCDPAQVSQVVTNVLLNAIKFTGRGGVVKLSCHREAGVLALDVSDNGPGIPVSERQVIFERGVRGSAANTAAGSGVGLAVVRGIVEGHGGTVTVADSRIGGALFAIRLPGVGDAFGGAGACAACGERHSAVLQHSVAPAAQYLALPTRIAAPDESGPHHSRRRA